LLEERRAQVRHFACNAASDRLNGPTDSDTQQIQRLVRRGVQRGCVHARLVLSEDLEIADRLAMVHDSFEPEQGIR
jgi:hypothetical protein